jgi:tripartite-type tricarboxylate transporter receptor subunit TctC
MKKHWLALVAAFALLAPIQPACAQPFPGKPVHIVNPYAAGGSGEVLVHAVHRFVEHANVADRVVRILPVGLVPGPQLHQ